jgi:hypothetical protein
MSEMISAGLDVSVFASVLDEGDGDARTALACQLAALLADDETSTLEREQVTPVILKLTVDPARHVRAVLAEELVSEQKLHSDIVFSIIADDDDIALPFLAHTPALNSWHMMAVLRVGDEAWQACVASLRHYALFWRCLIIRQYCWKPQIATRFTSDLAKCQKWWSDYCRGQICLWIFGSRKPSALQAACAN